MLLPEGRSVIIVFAFVTPNSRFLRQNDLPSGLEKRGLDPSVTTRAHEKNTVISLFQKLECSIFFKKANNSGFDVILWGLLYLCKNRLLSFCALLCVWVVIAGRNSPSWSYMYTACDFFRVYLIKKRFSEIGKPIVFAFMISDILSISRIRKNVFHVVKPLFRKILKLGARINLSLFPILNSSLYF